MRRSDSARRGRIDLDYRPFRRIYTIPPDLSIFRDAIRACSAVWGGALNFIAIEHAPGEWDELTRRCIASAAQLDEMLVIGPDADARVAHIRERERSIPRDGGRISLPHVLSVPASEILAPRPNMQPAFAHPALPMGAPLADLPQGDALPHHYAVAFGELRRDLASQTSLGYAGFYLTRWSPTEHSAIARTVAGIRGAVPISWEASCALTLVALPTPDALRELAWTWNIRAASWPFDNGVGLLPLFEIDASERTRQNIRMWFGRFPESRREVRVFNNDIPGVAEAVERIFLHGVSSPGPGVTESWWDAVVVRASLGEPELPDFPVSLVAHHSEHLAFESRDALAVTLTSPLEQTDGWCAIEVSGDPRLLLPRRDALARTLHPGGIGVSPRGITVAASPSLERMLELRLPSDAEIIATLAKTADLEFEPSSAWIHTEQLYRALGSDLSAANPLRDGTAIDVLREMAAARSSAGAPDRTLAQLRDRLHAAAAGGHLRRERIWRSVAALLRRRILFAGARVFCTNCELIRWRIIDELSTDMICAGCRSAIRFPALGATSDAEPAWSYVLNDAFSSLFLQGTAAVIVALAKLRDEAPDSFHFLAGVNVSGGTLQSNCELDAVVLVRSRVVVLEAKSTAAIAASQIDATLRIAHALAAEPCFATLEYWTDETQRRINDAAARSWPTCASPMFLDRRWLLNDQP